MLSEKAMAPHSSALAWKIPWMEEPGGLQSMGSLRVWHDWGTSLSFFTFMHWRRKWQPIPVFLPGESQGQGSLVGLLSMGSHRVGHDWSDLAAAGVCSCFSHLFVSNYLYLITHLPWWFLAFGSSFFCSASSLLKSLHFICQQPLMISKIPGVFLTSPSTSDEAPDLGSQDPGDIKMGNEPTEASSPIQTVWVVLLNHLILQEKQLNIFATYFFLILFLSHTVSVIV